MDINKIDKIVLKETAFVGAWILIFSAIMEAVFLIIGKWDYTVLLGNLLSGVMGTVNMLLLGMTVQRALASGDQKHAVTMIRSSQAVRLLVMAGVCILGATLDCFNLWATLIPLLFPRLAMIIRQIMLRKVTRAVKAMTAVNAIVGAQGEVIEGEGTDITPTENENGETDADPEGGEAIE